MRHICMTAVTRDDCRQHLYKLEPVAIILVKDRNFIGTEE